MHSYSVLSELALAHMHVPDMCKGVGRGIGCMQAQTAAWMKVPMQRQAESFKLAHRCMPPTVLFIRQYQHIKPLTMPALLWRGDTTTASAPAAASVFAVSLFGAILFAVSLFAASLLAASAVSCLSLAASCLSAYLRACRDKAYRVLSAARVESDVCHLGAHPYLVSLVKVPQNVVCAALW